MAGILPTIIDVSVWQGDIDWATAKGSIHFAILRVQDGTVLDKKLQRNISECQRLGIPYYCYGFYRGGGAQEANRMVARAKAAGATQCLGYVLDVEVSGLGGIAQAMAVLKAAGGKCGLYMAHNLYGAYGAGYGEDFVWIPRYGTNDGTAQKQPAYACDLWQFTSVGKVPGISGGVDCSACVNRDVAWFTGAAPKPATVTIEAVDKGIYRLYDAANSKHLFTPTHAEAEQLASNGWGYEGVAFTYGDGAEIMRMYNPNSGGHLLTTSHAEHDSLLRAGWACEGVSFRDGGKADVYRLYNASADDHVYTADSNERDSLVRAGWSDEGVAFKAA